MNLRRILTACALVAAMLQPRLCHGSGSRETGDSVGTEEPSSSEQDSKQKVGAVGGRQLRMRRGPLPDWALKSWFIRRQVEAAWVLRGVNVIDVRTGRLCENVNIVIAGDLIQSVGRDVPPDGLKVVDAGGKYVIPGLFDLHAHVIPKWPVFPTAKEPEETLRILLDSGVTTIRAIPLFSESALTWAALINDGSLVGPTIIPTSSIFEKTPQRTSRGFGDPQTVRAWVRKEALLGARWIKVYDNMDEDSLRAIVETGREFGMKVCGHASQVPPAMAAQIGMATIEHMISIPYSCLPDGVHPPEGLGPLARSAWCWEHADEVKLRGLMETFRSQGVGWVPTLVVLERIIELGGHDQRPFSDAKVIQGLRVALDRSAKLAVALHRAGGLVGVGTDFPVDTVPAGESVHREMELLVQRGEATPLEALQIATLSSARILGFGVLLGGIESGKIANLVVLDANPLDDISHSRRVSLVIHDGRLHRPN